MFAGVIGYPLKASLSPVFQQAAFDHLGIDVIYEAWPTPPDGLQTRISGLRAPSVVGANVTIPHKQAVIPMMDELDPLVGRIGAVNTIVNRDGKLHAHNTDGAGFLKGLTERAGFDAAGARAIIAGAGGSARAVAVALTDGGAASVTVINRTYVRAVELVESLRALAVSTDFTALPDIFPSWQGASLGCNLLINCTSAGSAGSGAESECAVPVDVIHPGMLVYDLIYRPAETVLIREARARGAAVLGGLPMLVYQGAASFELWTGRTAPVDVMFAAAEAALVGDD
jgi:shikimate dehydrogenase